LYRQAHTAFYHAWHHQPSPPDIDVPDLSASEYASPLDVLFEAFDHALSTPTTEPSQGERESTAPPSSDPPPATTTKPLPVDRVLQHEIKHWTRSMPEGVDPHLLRSCVALATLAGASNHPQAHALLRVLPELDSD